LKVSFGKMATKSASPLNLKKRELKVSVKEYDSKLIRGRESQEERIERT